MGLASMGGVHSSLEHVYEFLNVARSMASRMYSYTASWTAATLTQEAERAL